MNLLLQRNDETCSWLSCDDVVSCSYGKVGSAAMRTYGVVPAAIAARQIQSHLDHGWVDASPLFLAQSTNATK
jgi:hypothetical protein